MSIQEENVNIPLQVFTPKPTLLVYSTIGFEFGFSQYYWL